MDILIMNGPNLGFLGQRQPEIYGSQGMDAVPGMVGDLLGSSNAASIRLDYFQSNSEGGLIDRLEKAWQEKTSALVLNAGAYTHTSIAIGDAIRAVKAPVVEVHISNVHSREDFRQVSMISGACRGSVIGFGMDSYRLAVEALIHQN